MCIGILHWYKLGIDHVVVYNGDFDIPYSICAEHQKCFVSAELL